MRIGTLYGLIALAGAILIGSAALFGARAEPQPLHYNSTSGAVHLVTATGSAVCSGFFVGQGFILSAGHCVGDGIAKAILLDGESVPVTVAASSSPDFGLADWSIWKASTDGVKTEIMNYSLDCSDRERPIGHAVRVEGFPSQDEYNVVWGRISGPTQPDIMGEHFKTIRTNLPILPGNSGSPLIDDETDQVIGIVVTSDPLGRVINGSTTIGQVCSALPKEALSG
jgi:S1-C subfamily serine protease